MGMGTGLTVMGDYATPSGDPAKVTALLNLIPNPDVAPAQQGIKGFFDEMSPMCAAQLRKEIAALQAIVT